MAAILDPLEYQYSNDAFGGYIWAVDLRVNDVLIAILDH